MKKVFTILCLFILYSCSDKDPVSSTDTKSGGSILTFVSLSDQYNNSLPNFSGVVGEIYADNKLVQRIISDSSGQIEFTGLKANIYNFKYYKTGYSSYDGTDTLKFGNEQFVGAGQFNMNYRIINFFSKNPIDTSLWKVSDFSCEIEKKVSDITITYRDTLVLDTVGYDTEDGNMPITKLRRDILRGKGTSEFWKLKFHVEFSNYFPSFITNSTKIIYSNENNTFPGGNSFYFQNNQKTFDWVQNSPNTIVKDSLGNIVNKIKNVEYTKIKTKQVDVQLETILSSFASSHKDKIIKITSPKITVKLED